MKDLRKDYNRRYYRAIAKIQLKKHWSLTRLWVCSKLMKLAYKTDREAFTKIVLELSNHHEWVENEMEHYETA